MLDVRNLSVRYGPIHAVKGISLRVAVGEIVAVIGANGAGKTTALKAIAGLLPYAGEIAYDGDVMAPLQAEKLVGRGLALVPEGRGILARMTIEENLLMGAYARRDRRALAAEIEQTMDRFPVLRERRRLPANLLSGGEQQMLAIGRALMGRPKLLILDEPSLGLAPLIVERVFAIIEQLRRSGLTILLVEQKARQALAIADRAYVLETGRIIADGPAADLARGSVIADAFLGGDTAPLAPG
ncbi:MAG TPA: ABC transporter ATP-binding protein [Alphaproteobacteria bacterium]